MPQFKVKEKSFISNTIVEAGTVVDYDGIPGPNLELVGGSKADVKDAAKLAAEANNESLLRMHSAAQTGDPANIEATAAADAVLKAASEASKN